jgi:2'-5' RNA ligase
VQPVDATFSTTGWFGDRVLYLAPEPDGWFRSLIEKVCAAFPRSAPYGGEFDEVVPHLTVADRADRGQMAQAALEIERLLPLDAHVDEMLVMQGIPEPASWQIVERLSLGDQSIS